MFAIIELEHENGKEMKQNKKKNAFANIFAATFQS